MSRQGLPFRRIIQSTSQIVRPRRLLSSAKSSPLSTLRPRWTISSFHHPSSHDHPSSLSPTLLSLHYNNHLRRWRRSCSSSDSSTKKCNAIDECDEKNDIVVDDRRNNEGGEKLYNLAAEAMRNADKSKRSREERLLVEQYDAAEKGRAKTRRRKERRGNESSSLLPPEDDTKDRAAGMAVVRTIVEQTRASNNDAVVVRVEKWNTGNDDDGIMHNEQQQQQQQQQQSNDEEYWHKMARLYMEESALRYGHGPALVRLGNDALDRARRGDDDDSISSSAIVDRDRCMGWKNESPVRRLELMFEITTNSSTSCLELAKHLYEEAGERGSPDGLYNLGHILWDEDDFVSAMDAFHSAMTMGDADAMYFVAAQYLSYEKEEDDDDGVTSFLPTVYERYGPEYVSSTLRLDTTTMTPPSSLENDIQRHGYVLLYQAVHKHGHGPATHHLALLCNQNGDINEFCKLLSLAADVGGNPDSLFLRGHCYYFGADGHTRDMSLAFADFIAAADGGNFDAMVSAGAMLHQGVRSDDGMTIIVNRDQQRAFELYQRAGELGSIEGWRNVVSCYATGEGVKKCLDTAKYIANTMLKDDR